MSDKFFQKPKGTADLLPAVQPIWQKINQIAQDVFGHRYRFGKIDTPLFENYEIFSRTSGDSSDVVSKEMYDFKDKGDRRMALRPEGTAGVVRAYVENKLYGPEYEKPVNLYYLESMFRYERPQAGRMREFHQVGVESFGSDSPYLDAQIIQMAIDFFKEFKLTDLVVKINSLGDDESRTAFRTALVDYLVGFQDQLSEDSKKRLQTNPMRILDSKDRNDQKVLLNAPHLLDYLNQDSKSRFQKVTSALDDFGIEYVIDDKLVRGLDYYNHTIFEIETSDPKLKSAATICGGGRYSGMVEDFGGPATPAIGFGIGLERLITLVGEVENQDLVDVYIVQTDHSVNAFANLLAKQLRERFHFGVLLDYTNRSMKSQFKSADRTQARYSIVVGEQEVSNKELTIKKMVDGSQKKVLLQQLKIEDFL
ncbi:histidine--tRNA ligase [Oenococcus sicerae]|uniref:Histidine--tRNA ligase n=1 Tax=Oenococcus sicerae TaxID=2203724 RepID=A0AAJ1RBE5_9LACO|nr:histidine--tRNA ligase [Oenococcus sicerae]MDN6901000.1 histidine--tRNA ligase [Oenococcus sicerae]QAS70036.1 histidine--tRNA ligase [Oenococcus sicerae]